MCQLWLGHEWVEGCYRGDIILVGMSDAHRNQKRNNARVMKWREMLKQGLFADPGLLVRRTRKGIPTSMRIKVWPELIKIRKIVEQNTLSYSKVLIKDSKDIYDINLDIPRTFTFEAQQILKQSLFNVLKALSIEFPKIGYCQGMNFLVMRLLQVLDDDTTFYFMMYLLRKHKSIYDNFRNPGFVTRQNHVYSHLMQQFMPKLNKVLQEQMLEPVMYTPSWFLTLFSKSLSEAKFCRFFQCFLVEGYCFLYKMVLAMMKLKENGIRGNTLEQNFVFVPNMDYYETIPDDELIETACKFDFDNQFIKNLEEDYNKNHRAELEALEKSSEEAYSRKLSSPRWAFQWTMEDFSKLKVNLVKFEE